MTDLVKQAAVAAAKEQIELLNDGQHSFLFGDAWIGQLAEIIKRHYEPLERETWQQAAEIAACESPKGTVLTGYAGPTVLDAPPKNQEITLTELFQRKAAEVG